MHSTTYWVVVVAIILAAIAAVAGALVWVSKQRENYRSYELLGRTTQKKFGVERFTQPSEFRVFNYFPKHAISLDVVVAQGEDRYSDPIDLIDHVPPKKAGSLTRSQVVQYLAPGNVLRFHIIDPKTKIKKHFTDYMVDTDSRERVKNLHVGMITTRFIGGSMDSLNLTTTHANAGGGNAWLMVHNPTYLPLRLNDDIEVAPHSTFRYLGYLHQGVTLGTYLKDRDNMYPDFQYLRPHNSIYYGVVSDIRQPLYGCWQFEFHDQCDYGQTLWPFQEGVV